MNQQLQTQTKEAPRATKLAHFLQEKAEDFKAVATIDTDKFLRVVKNAILRDPEIAEASTQSVYLECMKAMNDGLVLDGREAALTRFKTNKRKKNPQTGQWEDNWQIEVVYIPMMAGIMKRVRASGEIKSWTVELVYQQEHEQGRFRYVASPDPMIMHEPIIVGERGPVVAAYSAVRLIDGSYHYEVMTREQLDAIKARTKSKKTKRVDNQEVTEITGPWATDEEEMFRKTVLRRHSKRLPVSSGLIETMNRVDGLYDFDGEIVDPPAEPANRGKSNAASKLKAAAAAKAKAAPPIEQETRQEPEEKVLEGDIIDGETGEIIKDGEGGGKPSAEDEF